MANQGIPVDHVGYPIRTQSLDFLNPTAPMWMPLLNRDKKPAIHLSYIHPPTSKAKDAGTALFLGNQEWPLYNIYVQSVEPHPRNHFGVRQSLKCDIEKIVYNELAERSSVTGLVFHLIGHDFIIKDIQHDFSCYSSTVRDIEFDGHLSYVTPAFQIISQLSSLKRIKFNLGSRQMPFYLEASDKDYDNFIIPPNQNAYSLSVKVDPKAYQRGGERNKQTINVLIEAIFRRAGECLPKLAHLDIKLPATDESFLIFEKLLHNISIVKGEAFITIEITPILNTVSCQCIIVAEENDASSNRSILSDKIVPFPDLSESGNYQRDKDLLAAYEKLKKAFVFLENLAQSVPRFPYVLNPEPRVPVMEPPPGFEYLYNRIRIVSIQTQSTPRLTRPEPTEMDQVFMSINRNQEAVERNQARLRLSRLIEEYEESVQHPLRDNQGFLSRSVVDTLMRWYDDISDANH